MGVRIATGSEVVRKRTFITSNGKLTTPEEYFSSSKAKLGKNRVHQNIKGREGSKEEEARA